MSGRIIQPKKSLGQHFLKDKNIARKIVESLKEEHEKPIVEIGPGTGILTEFLQEKGFQKLTLVEIDSEAVKHLEKEFPNINILHRDILKVKLADIYNESFSLIGNLPYNISSQIFFKILESREFVGQAVCMIQKEVAQRITASPGSREYGILSVLLQAYFDIRILFSVGPKVFDPPPKVHSAVVQLSRNHTSHLDCDEKLFVELVKRSFNQRRKMLRNSLSSFLLPLQTDQSILKKRPEQLSVDEFVELANMVDKGRKKM